MMPKSDIISHELIYYPNKKYPGLGYFYRHGVYIQHLSIDSGVLFFVDHSSIFKTADIGLALDYHH